jgi:hypothetical protein
LHFDDGGDANADGTEAENCHEIRACAFRDELSGEAAKQSADKNSRTIAKDADRHENNSFDVFSIIT